MIGDSREVAVKEIKREVFFNEKKSKTQKKKKTRNAQQSESDCLQKRVSG